ncbi:hypothetical protein CMUS01_02110 [Colletotrichum musicola]|uniref:Secreted protein n=1 Tax=Colletotrichum musicola TaxID=2175873 RepID=A0A8H6U846_9PEZI|nr:hypothetical protein CMUS01_02110 [Colletotrichum musicola]
MLAVSGPLLFFLLIEQAAAIVEVKQLVQGRMAVKDLCVIHLGGRSSRFMRGNHVLQNGECHCGEGWEDGLGKTGWRTGELAG